MDIEAKIKKQDRFFLYILPAFFAGLSAYVFIRLDFDPVSLIMVIPFSLMALFFHLKHKANTSFKEMKTVGNKSVYDKCKEIARSNGWELLVTEEEQLIIAHTKGSWRSWGELVTFKFQGDLLLVNSRPSPFKKASIVTWGKNRINLKAVEAAVTSG
ncbi:hypothetical protein TUM3794_39800 [Shewanella colwelliana]|uniref:YcxB-like protein domain-containing protein n=1 Tax=Shewanella colwelliana TaxID=23 RepID=A0ABQ4PH91_SHECO|nr:hypothetical protein [Shewanella colwelliana]GIU46794.1 hypothetical protein TUM3794_39800 [Shewanella colwelliana]